MKVVCPACRVCNQHSVLEGVDALGFVEWSEFGKDIQKALPDLDEDQRELLISGTHAHCWQILFGQEED